MIRSFINTFGSTLYVQIWENRIRVVDINSNEFFDEKPLLQIETRNKWGQMTLFLYCNVLSAARPESA